MGDNFVKGSGKGKTSAGQERLMESKRMTDAVESMPFDSNMVGVDVPPIVGADKRVMVAQLYLKGGVINVGKASEVAAA